MYHRGGGKQAVNHGNRTNGGYLSPRIRNHFVDGQDATGKTQSSCSEPAFQNVGPLRITPPSYLFYASAHLSKRQYAKKYVSFLHPRVPSSNVDVTAVAFAELRDDVGIKQICQNSMSLGNSRGRTKYSSSMGQDASSSLALMAL